MKVKVTKVLARTLNKNIKEFSIEYDEMSEAAYRAYVDSNLFNNEGDYNYNTGKFKVFRVVYPDGCYSFNRYITTKDLLRVFSRVQNASIEAFCKELVYEYGI